MISRERVLKTIHHQQPHWPPIFVTLTPQMAESLSQHLGMPYKEPLIFLLSTRISHMELLLALGNDRFGIATFALTCAPSKTLADGTIVND